MKKRMKKVATLCLAGVTAMSTVGVTGSAVFAKGDTNYDVDNMDFENVELRVAFRFNNGSDTDGQAKWYYKALEEFNKENEGKIHVTDESISTESDYEEKPDYGRITRNGNKYYVHIYENTLGPLPLLGFDKDKIVKVRALDDGHEVPISNAWMHSDYPDIAFVDLGPDPVLPDPVDYVLEVEMAE